MSKLKISSDIAQELRALVPGLPRFCTRIVLTLEVDKYPEVVATFHPESDTTGMASAAREFKPGGDPVTQRYQLIPI